MVQEDHGVVSDIIKFNYMDTYDKHSHLLFMLEFAASCLSKSKIDMSYNKDKAVEILSKLICTKALLEKILNLCLNTGDKSKKFYEHFLLSRKEMIRKRLNELNTFLNENSCEEGFKRDIMEEKDGLEKQYLTLVEMMKHPSEIHLDEIHEYDENMCNELYYNILKTKVTTGYKEIINEIYNYYKSKNNVWRKPFYERLDNLCKELKLNKKEKKFIEFFLSSFFISEKNTITDIMFTLDLFKEGYEHLKKIGVFEVDGIVITMHYEKFRWMHNYFDERAIKNNVSLADIIIKNEYKKSDNKIDIDDYPEDVQNKINDVKTLIKNHDHNHPLNILLWGKAGSGKSTLIELLQQYFPDKRFININSNLLQKNEKINDEMEETDHDTKATLRLQELKLCANLALNNQFVFIMDEADDSLNSSYGLTDKWLTGKKELNELLDSLTVPVIWITNHKNSMDESTCRRFQYSIKFDKLTSKQREKVWKKQIELTNTQKYIKHINLEEIISDYDLTPGVIALILNNLKILNPRKEEVNDTIKNLINNHLSLIEQKKTEDQSKPNNDNYDIDGLNIKSQFSLDKIVPSLKKFIEKLENGTAKNKNICILLNGVPGTGKTEFAKYISRELNKKLIYKVYGDLANCYVGETEHNIEKAFNEAEDEHAILFFDEADSLIFSREKAFRSWESSQTNEVLTRMERFKGIFIASTNFIENIDNAAMRRFQLKIKFDYLDNSGKEKFFKRFFDVELKNKEALFKINMLTPGDFKAVRDKIEFLCDDADDNFILNELQEEVNYKKAQNSIGF